MEENGKNMKTYKYETHLHTSQASACASASGDDYIEKYKPVINAFKQWLWSQR